MDGCNVRAVDGLHVAVRARGHDLHHLVAIGQLGQQGLPVAGFGLARIVQRIGPVLEEHRLQPVDHRPLQPHVHVVVGIGLDAFVLLVGDVHAAGVADAPVDHHDLAVAAEIDDRPHAPPQARGVEQRHLAASGFQQRVMPPRQALGTQGIHQQAHGHAFARLLTQRRDQAQPGPVGLENVVLQMDVLARLAHGRQDAVEGGGAAHQQLDPVGGADGEIRGRGHQLDHLVQALGGLRHLLLEPRHAAAHARTAAAAQAPQTLALEPPWAQEVIDHQPQHRNHRH